MGKPQVLDMRSFLECILNSHLLSKLYNQYPLNLQGKTIGEILKDEIKIEGIHSGVKDQDLEKIHPTKLLPLAYIFSQSLTPQWAGKKLKITMADLLDFWKIMRRAKTEGGLVSDKPPFVNSWPKDLDQTWLDMVQGKDCAKAEFCSFNTQANAKGTVFLYLHQRTSHVSYNCFEKI